MIESSPWRERRVEQPERADDALDWPASGPPCRRTRSPTRNGRALSRTVPAKRLPSVCWAARPRITAVNAPPSASVRGSRPATRSATIVASDDEDEPDQEADGARRRRVQAPEEQRPERAPDVARDLPAEDVSATAVTIGTGVSNWRRRAPRGPYTTTTPANSGARQRLDAGALDRAPVSWRASPTSRHEWLRVSNSCLLTRSLPSWSWSERGSPMGQHRLAGPVSAPGVVPITRARDAHLPSR